MSARTTPSDDDARAPGTVWGVVGVVLVLLAMFLVGPIGVFVVAALWSGLFGWLLVDDAERQAGAEPQAS